MIFSLYFTQRLKAALHYVIGQAYEDVAIETGISINREVMAAVTEMVYGQCSVVAQDVELFAK